MGINIGHVVVGSFVLAIGSFVYVVGFEPMDESTNPRARAINQVPARAAIIASVRRLMAQGRLSGADGVANTLVEHNPEDPGAYFYRAIIDELLEKNESAMANWTILDAQLRSLQSWPERYTPAQLEYFRAWAKYGVGRIEESRALFGGMADKLEAQVKINGDEQITNSGILFNLACYRSMAGETEIAIEHWARAVEFGYVDQGWWAVDPDLKPLHSDTRFWAAGRLLDRATERDMRDEESESEQDPETESDSDISG